MYLPNQMDSPSCLVSVYVFSLPVRHWLNFNREGVGVIKKTKILEVHAKTKQLKMLFLVSRYAIRDLLIAQPLHACMHG